ncbi:hypothetical protein D3C81_1979380 [compost metagenome]
MHQQQDVGGHAQRSGQQLQPGTFGQRQDHQADQVVEDDRAGQQDHELRVPPAIEHDRGHAQPQRGQPRPHRTQRVMHAQCDRQEHQQEQEGVEKHRP